jgi:hypothetical protein
VTQIRLLDRQRSARTGLPVFALGRGHLAEQAHRFGPTQMPSSRALRTRRSGCRYHCLTTSAEAEHLVLGDPGRFASVLQARLVGLGVLGTIGVLQGQPRTLLVPGSFGAAQGRIGLNGDVLYS